MLLPPVSYVGTIRVSAHNVEKQQVDGFIDPPKITTDPETGEVILTFTLEATKHTTGTTWRTVGYYITDYKTEGPQLAGRGGRGSQKASVYNNGFKLKTGWKQD